MATNYDYIGKGTVFAAVLTGSTPGAYFSLGNCSAASFAISEETKELLDYTSAGGGTKNKISRISGVELTITAHDLSPKNLERALRGTASAITATTVTDEVQTAYHDALCPFDFIPNTEQTITIKSNDSVTTYVKDTDYTLSTSGIMILSTGSIGDGDSIKCSYTKLASDVVEALTGSGEEYSIIFQGLNEAQSGRTVDIRAYRVKFSPTSGLDAISDDFSSIELKGAVLSDSSKVGTGISQYLKVTLASALAA